MNTAFASVGENGDLTYAESYVERTVQGATIRLYGPSEEQYNEAGFYRVNGGYIPTVDAGYHLVPTGKWEVVSNECRQIYRVEEDEKTARKFSKLKLYAVLTRMNLWAGLVDWMKTQQVEGMDVYTAFTLANELTENHPMFAPYLKLAQDALGVDDATLETILSSSVMED